jgi:hypothetical protein
MNLNIFKIKVVKNYMATIKSLAEKQKHMLSVIWLNFSLKFFSLHAAAHLSVKLCLLVCRFIYIFLATKCFSSPRGFPTLFLDTRQVKHTSRKNTMYINTQVITGTNPNLY